MKKRLLEIYDGIFEREYSAGRFPDRFTYLCWKKFYRSFMERYVFAEVFRVTATEKEIEFPLFEDGDGITITGRIDRIDELPDGFEIIDYKTSVGKKFKEKSFKSRIFRGEIVALPLYFFATPEAKKISIFWIADREIPEDYPKKISLDEGEFLEVSEKMLEKVRGAVSKIKKGDIFPDGRSTACYNCEYKYICETAKNVWQKTEVGK